MMKTINEVNERIGDLIQQGVELSQYLEWLNRFPTTTSEIEAKEIIKDMDTIDKEIEHLETLRATL